MRLELDQLHHPVRPARSLNRLDSIACWSLIALGLAMIAPTILLPEWREYQRNRLAEEAWKQRLEVMRQKVARADRLAEGLRSDPLVIERAAMRELNLLPPESEAVYVPAAFRNPSSVPAGKTFISLPPWIQTALSPFPAMNYDRTFCQEPFRTVVIGLSLTLICMALCLFGVKKASSAG